MPTRRNHLCSFLSRLALCGLAAPLILLSPTLARADTVRTFKVSGTAENVNFFGGPLGSCAVGATCAFSGMFQVDTTIGKIEGSNFDITFPGLPVFDRLFGANGHALDATNSAGNLLELLFTTAPTPDSLVGLTSGSIEPARSSTFGYDNISGSFTPVPEPSSLVLFAGGLLVLGLTRRFGKKVGHPLSA